jgi:serine/threonine-protein kinase
LNAHQRQLRSNLTNGDLPEDASITTENKLVGTVTHIAPEQLAGKEATEQSDIYAAGITLYGLAYGRMPFRGSADEVLQSRYIQEVNFWPPDGRQVPEALRLIIEKATRESPAVRYQSAGEMAEDLERYLLR